MRRTSWRHVLALLAVFAAYVGTGKLGLQLATVNASATAVWPPTGIAIAALLVVGYRAWPAVAVGAFVVNATTSAALPSLGIAAGNTLEALAGAYLIARFANGPRAFVRLASVLRFAGVALLVPMVSATVGVATLVASGLATGSDAAAVWSTWWIGDVTGALIATPLILVWATPAPRLRGSGDRAEAIALGVAAAALVLVGFSRFSPLGTMRDPLGFLAYPVLVWAAFRFGPRGAATLVASLSLLAVGAAALGGGPFAGADPNGSLLVLQSFMAVASVTSLALAAAVVERQHAEESLRATEERLRRAEENKVAARDEFLSVAAHELRTPLTSLQLAAQYFQRHLDSARFPSTLGTLRAASAIESQTKRLAELVGLLLDTVRVQAGRMELLTSEQDVVAVATRVADDARALTGRHEIVLETPKALTAVVDPIRLEQVLRNLVDNAVKFSPGGRIVIDLAADEGTVVIGVRDHGPGIPPVDRPYVFDRFFQAREERPLGGLGLGLHVSRHIVELHGGTIAAEFPEDGGTRMVVRLPLRVAPAAPELQTVLR